MTIYGTSICVCVELHLTTPLMVFSVMYTICKEPKLDAQIFQSVTPTNCQHNFICQHK